MLKLPVVTARECIRALQRAGFVMDRQTGSHVALVHPERRLTTVVPYHRGDLRPGTLRNIIRQAGLTVEEFVDLL